MWLTVTHLKKKYIHFSISIIDPWEDDDGDPESEIVYLFPFIVALLHTSQTFLLKTGRFLPNENETKSKIRTLH